MPKIKLNLENLIYLTIFLLPAYLVSFNFFRLPTNVLEILIALVLLAWVAKIKNGFALKQFLQKYKNFGLSLGLIFVGLLLATIINGNYPTGLGILKGWFVAPLLFAAVVQLAVPRPKQKNIFTAYFTSAFALAVLGVVHFFLGGATYDGRLALFFNSPNYLAMYLAPALIMGILFFREKPRIYFLSLLILFWAFALTASYAAWLAALAVIVGMFWLRKEKRIFWALLLLVGFFLLSQSGGDKLTGLLQQNERSSLASRMMIWQASQKIIADNWLFGIGPGNFQAKYLAYQKYFPPYLEWAVPHPHSLYLNFWLSGGLLGLVGFLSLLLFWARELYQKRNTRTNYQLAAAAIVVYIMLHGLVDTTYFKNDLAVVFWLNFWLSIG